MPLKRHPGEDEGWSRSSDYDLRWPRMAQELQRAGSVAVSPRLKNYHQVANGGPRQLNPLREDVERSAERANNGDLFTRWLFVFFRQCDRVVLANHLPEIAGRR